MTVRDITADEVIERLGLRPHPEGGHYRETWRAPAAEKARSPGTAIYYLLDEGETSHWHKVDATEIWHWYAGAPLTLHLSADGISNETGTLGPDIPAGQSPQIIIPAGHWQSARTTTGWTLVGCTVSPGFEFGGFELAPPGWNPGR